MGGRQCLRPVLPKMILVPHTDGPSMADANRKLLNDAVERNAAAVLSLPIDGLLQHCKSRFLALVEQGIWIQSEPSRIDLIDTLIGRQAVVAVSFRNGHQKASFA